MDQQNNEILTSVKNLYEQVKMLKAGEGHVTINEVFGDKAATVVISVYDGQRPSNEVLDELFEWAEGEGLTNVADKIIELSEM